ncbi:40S ribosomal protein S12, mitochondrial [Orchesella cincta]|uniref:Small ribosomal subunit protein uS12m n=1 Tax=Orchesella cincta TaxID=48709 RepID=A0A1D2N4E9_ORCCI|nr:40S ribosomal protein S12, mitochondrial [Orchesella cincta]
MNITRRAINLLVKGSQKLDLFSKCGTRNLINPVQASLTTTTNSKSLFWMRDGVSRSSNKTLQYACTTLPCRSSFLVDSVLPSLQMNLRLSDRVGEHGHSNPLSWTGSRDYSTLKQQHKNGPHKKFRPPRKPLDGAPMLKGVVLKTLIKKPKKPNSANRKCVLVRLSNGKEKIAHVPGIGHNLQEHNVVLVRCGRLQDVPGVKLKCIRGKYDLAHVIKQQPK